MAFDNFIISLAFIGRGFMIIPITMIIRWMSLGNQLSGVRLVDEGLRARFKAAYPEVEVQPASPPRASAMEVDSGAVQMRNPFSAPEPKSTAAQFTESATPGAPFAAPEDKPMIADIDIVN